MPGLKSIRSDQSGLSELTLSSVAELAKVSELTLSSPIQQELIGKFLINQQGFDVDFSQHGSMSQ